MKSLAKRSLTIFLAVLMLLSVMVVGVSSASAATNFIAGDTLYFRPNSQWGIDSARFAAYFYSSDTSYEWVSMKDTNNDSYYEITVPKNGYSNIIFCRLNSKSTENNWDNVMNQTANLEFDGKNDCFEMTGGSWNEGTWSVYAEKLVYFVNTKNWTEVAAYCTNYSSAGDIWPGDLCDVVDKEKGIYSVYPGNYPRIVFTANNFSGDHTATYDYSAVKGKYIEPTTGGIFNTAEEALAAATISLAGSFNDWAVNKDIFKHYKNNIFHTSLLLSAGTYTFKVVQNGIWYGASTTINNSTNKDVALVFTGGDCALETSGGQYDFYFDVSKKTLSVTYTEADVDTDDELPTVALSGSFNDWGTTDLMSGSNNSTVFTKTLELERGDYYFSIVENGLWYGSSIVFTDSLESQVIKVNGGACTLKASGGKYTFNFDYTKNTLSVSAVTNADPADLTTVSLAGDFNDWSTTDTKLNKISPDTVSATIELKAGTYYFKVVQDSLWYGNRGTIKDTTDTGWEMSMTSGNCVLQASGGTYTFTYVVNSKLLTVDFEPSDEDPAETAKVALVGDFNSWNRSSNPFIYSGTNTVTATIDITPGVYNLKIVDGDLWYGVSTAIKNSVSKLRLSHTGGNCTLTATGGTYTFVYNVVDKTLAISYVPSEEAPAKTAKVSLAGTFNEWDTNATKMTMKNDYEVSSTLSLDAGIYNFKIVHGVSWYGKAFNILDTTNQLSLSCTGGDCLLYASGGDYTFTYDVVGHTLTITYVPSNKDPAETAVVSLAGEFNGWSLSANTLTYSSKNTVSTTVELENGTYMFKMVTGGLWYGNSGTIVDTTTTTSDTGWEMYPTDGECTLQATGGTYTFSYNVITNKLVVTAVVTDPAKTAKVSLAGSFNDWEQTTNKFSYSSKNTVSTTVELTKGEHYFKIVENNLWYGNGETIINNTTDSVLSIIGGNCILNASGGKYTFTYNVVTKSLTITSTLSDPATTAVVSLAGDFNDWDTTANMFTYETNGIVTTSVTLEAGTYQFKVVHDSLWYGNNGTINDNTLGSSNSGWNMSIYEGNCTLEATGGRYTFTYKVETNSLIVSHYKLS